MPRPKKDGEKVSVYLDRTMMMRLRAYADDRGQTLTTAMERIITQYLDREGVPFPEPRNNSK